MKISDWIALGSLIIALCAFILAIFSFLKTRDQLEIVWHRQVVKLHDGDIFGFSEPTFPAPIYPKMRKNLKDLDAPHKSEEKPTDKVSVALTVNNAYLLQLSLVNFGPNDMGYFQLHVHDESGDEFVIETGESIEKQGVKYLLQRATKSRWVQIKIPPALTGTIPAHSYTDWNIVISDVPENTTKLIAEIALTKKKWFKPWSKAFIGHDALFDLHSPKQVIDARDIYLAVPNKQNSNGDNAKDQNSK